MREISPLPQHVAIIMDGNGRWAEVRGLPRIEGHKAGVKNVKRVVEGFAKYGVKYLTLFAFSTENWNRPKKEVQALLRLLKKNIDLELEYFQKNNIRLVHLGRLDGLSPDVQEKVKKAIEMTKGNKGMTLCIAFNYGSRAEIINAVRELLAEGFPPERLNEAVFSQYLYTAGLPEPDLIIRTGGEMRMSNFLLWQSAYSELYFTSTFWPDFDEEEIEKALLSYSQRKRRFGRLPSQ